MIVRVDHALATPILDLLIDPLRGWTGATDSRQILGFVDLDSCPENIKIEPAPPFPLIGLGNHHHPLADALDAIIEPPVSAEMLLRQVSRTPHAAAVAVQLLR